MKDDKLVNIITQGVMNNDIDGMVQQIKQYARDSWVLSEEELHKIIEKHKWNISKYVIENKTLDVGQSSKDLAKAIHSKMREKFNG